MAQSVADNTGLRGAFGTTTTFPVSAGGTYAGITTTVASTTGTPVPPAAVGPVLYSTAILRAGTASASTVVGMAWRTRVLDEVSGYSSDPPFRNGSPPYDGIFSDVLNLTGIVQVAPTAPDGRHPTDVYVLQMDYNVAEVFKAYDVPGTVTIRPPGFTDSQYENYIADFGGEGGIKLHYLNLGSDGAIGGTGTATDYWLEATSGNFARGVNAVDRYRSSSGGFAAGSWDSFANQYGVTSANLSQFLGSWGTDTTNHQVWAVLDHASQFAVVPEPTGLALLVPTFAMLARRSRR